MSLNLKVTTVLAAFVLAGCGGGGGSTPTPAPMTPPSPTPAADTDAPTLEISAADIGVAAGQAVEFEVTATDSGGFDSTAVTCTEGDVTTTTDTMGDTQTLMATFSAPATPGSVNCTATSIDSAGNSANLDFTILVSALPVVTADFNGTWFGPCFNNSFGFSFRQTLTIAGTSLSSAIESFGGGASPALNCSLPAGEGLVIDTDVTTALNFQSDVDLAGCLNDRAVETSIDILTVDTSGNPTETSEPGISDTLTLVTGFTNVIPSPTNICLLPNNNLLLGGVEYTGETNTTIIDPTFDIGSDVAWSLGDNNYTGGTSSSAESLDGNTGVLVVSTANDTANGDFSGSAVNFTHTLQGSGVYQLTTVTEVASAGFDESTAKLLSLSASVGTGVTTGSTSYISTENGGFVIAVLDDEGRYHFSTDQPVTVERSIDVLGGVPNAPDSFELEMTNLFDFEN